MFAIPCILSHASAEGSESDRSCHRLVAIIVNKLAFAVGDDLFGSNNKKFSKTGSPRNANFFQANNLQHYLCCNSLGPKKGRSGIHNLGCVCVLCMNLQQAK